MSRCYYNNFNVPEKDEDKDNYISEAKKKLQDYVFSVLINKTQSPDCDKRRTSLGKHKYDPLLYTGSGGAMYYYWRFYLLCKTLKKQGIINDYNKDFNSNVSSMKLFEVSVNTHFSMLLEEEKANKQIHSTMPSSFYLGPPGILTMKILYCIENNDKASLKPLLENLISYKKSAMSERSEHEILYGYAGFLWTLLFIQKKLTAFNYEYDMSTHITELFFYIVKQGAKHQKDYNTKCLAYIFPSDTKVEDLNDFYLGAAHGILGNLYVLVECIIMYEGILNRFKEYATCKKLIEDSLDHILTLQFPSGNFPSALGKDKDNKLHFCHGATGALYVYMKAYQCFKKKEYLVAVHGAANDIWERGIVLKGNSICHGILGSSYALHSMYKLTSDKSWLVKSYAMALFGLDEKVIEAVSKQNDKQRKVQGMQDSPYSLMDGNGGQLSLYSDLVSGSVVFPGFEF
eukprot:CAMPEP_0170517608 /NCGR_PEP_ID=MMETSP0209-20121228/3540_1 /TAXON_ID=665100 ORGANISM="Litonotus pictus, Strain P1" /NCGR_SAMPLE_ID=MMETSP0209 /ASSEMBLY_ACC=CAM_ASM_000301 /LENGTH=457 /DNA_ID=CAMNT_0010802897 /DNA_START=21 /DNA_END=1397 /DNA_ORIENTATION=+